MRYNKALHMDKVKLPCIRKSHASLPLPLSWLVRLQYSNDNGSR